MNQLSSKEQQFFVLLLTKACLECAKNNNKTFEEVLIDDVFATKASIPFTEMVCNNLNSLQKQGYIKGNVQLEYETETNLEMTEEKVTESIDVFMSTFSILGITPKGNTKLCLIELIQEWKETIPDLKNNAQELSKKLKELYEKFKPWLKQIANTAISRAILIAIEKIISNVLQISVHI